MKSASSGVGVFFSKCKWFGLIAVSIASSLLGGSLSHADTVGYWKFDAGANYLTDSSGNNLDLTASPVPPISTPLPGSGAGSNFGEVSGNTNAAGFPGGSAPGGVSAPHVADAPVLSLAGSFTIEALVNYTGTAPTFYHFAGQYDSGSNNRSWSLSVAPVGFANLDLARGEMFALHGTVGTDFNVIGSDINLRQGVDYALASSYDAVAKATTFYAQDLAAGTVEISTIAHGFGPVHDSPSDFTIGSLYASSQSGDEVTGLIDEVRLSNVALSGNELLVPVPEPTSLTLLGLGVCTLIFNRRRCA